MKKATFSAKCVSEKIMWIISAIVNARAFKAFAIVFSTPENLLIGISGAARRKDKPLSMQKYVLWKWCRVSLEMVNARAFKPLPLCSSTPENLLVGMTAALGMKESHFLS